MSNLKLAHAIIKLAQKILDNKPPTELELQVAKEIKNLTRSMFYKDNMVQTDVDFNENMYYVRFTLRELWNGDIFAFYEFSDPDYPREWTLKFDTKPYKGNPKKIAESLISEVKKKSKNILSNVTEDNGFSQKHV
jgi:hypothetical protein